MLSYTEDQRGARQGPSFISKGQGTQRGLLNSPRGWGHIKDFKEKRMVLVGRGIGGGCELPDTTFFYMSGGVKKEGGGDTCSQIS